RRSSAHSPRFASSRAAPSSFRRVRRYSRRSGCSTDFVLAYLPESGGGSRDAMLESGAEGAVTESRGETCQARASGPAAEEAAERAPQRTETEPEAAHGTRLGLDGRGRFLRARGELLLQAVGELRDQLLR